MKCAAALLLLACVDASAHAISMSNGYATLDGNRVEYILRMPDYEVPRGIDAARQLLDRIRFSSGFETARRVQGECRHDAAHAAYLCGATYAFSHPVHELTVECSFYEATAPNHIHMLHATRGTENDQAILDSSFTSANLLFRPPTAWERAAEQVFAAGKRVVSTWTQLLLLIALALAARTWSELLGCALAYIAAEIVACLCVLRWGWQAAPGFAEAAIALALAYLAFEMLIFPDSGGRWLLATFFGAFSGIYYASFTSEAAFRPIWVLAGSGLMFAIGLGLVMLFTRALQIYRRLIVRVTAVPLLFIALIWFGVRLRG